MLILVYLVSPADGESEVTVVVDEEDEDADEPLVGQVAEDDEEGWEAVVQAVLEEIALGPDEEMGEESAEVLAELDYVEDFHLEGFVRYLWEGLSHRVGGALASQPGRHEIGVDQDFIGPNWAADVVEAGVAPLDECVGSPFLGGGIGVSLFGDVVFLTGFVEEVVDKQVEGLGGGMGTV